MISNLTSVVCMNKAVLPCPTPAANLGPPSSVRIIQTLDYVDKTDRVVALTINSTIILGPRPQPLDDVDYDI